MTLATEKNHTNIAQSFAKIAKTAGSV